MTDEMCNVCNHPVAEHGPARTTINGQEPRDFIGDAISRAVAWRVEEIRRYQKALRRKARQVAKLRAELASWHKVAKAQGWPPLVTIPAIVSDAPVDKTVAQVTHWEVPK